MKKIGLIVLLSLMGGLALRAQTNAPVSELATNETKIPAQPPRGPTFIDSDSVNFDMAAHEAVYLGHVRVDDPEMKMTCARLIADLPPTGGRPNRIVAETNVVIDFTDEKGQTMHATSDRAIYLYEVKNGATNETVTLTGNAKVENAQGWLTGEPIVWNRANDSISATNQQMIYRQNFGGVKTETNLTTTNNLHATEKMTND